MRLIFKAQNRAEPKHPLTYVITLPNYYNVDHVPELLDDVSINCLDGSEIYEHYLMGDDHITNEERKQLDIHGKIVNAPIPLSCNHLIRR